MSASGQLQTFALVVWRMAGLPTARLNNSYL